MNSVDKYYCQIWVAFNHFQELFYSLHEDSIRVYIIENNHDFFVYDLFPWGERVLMFSNMGRKSHNSI